MDADVDTSPTGILGRRAAAVSRPEEELVQRKLPKIGEGRDRFHAKTIEHWDLIVEALGRVLVFSDIPEHRRPPWTPLDVKACFVLTYHLRDFLIEYEQRPKVDIDPFIREHPALSICRDICTNVKHAVMHSAPYHPDGDQLELTAQSAEFAGGPGGVFHRVYVEIDGRKLSAAGIAQQAYFDWIEWGMPWQDHTAPVWQLAEPTSSAPGVEGRVLRTPRSEAWEQLDSDSPAE